MASGSGYCVLETDSADAVSSWIYNWAPTLDAQVTPVLDDAEVRAVVSAKLAG
jgi:hypothetical protein